MCPQGIVKMQEENRDRTGGRKPAANGTEKKGHHKLGYNLCHIYK